MARRAAETARTSITTIGRAKLSTRRIPPRSSRTWPSGVLAPRPARPRNLEYGVYRGGSRPEDLYRRILNGISGTPMPAVPLRPADAKPDDQRLTSDDVWHLVAYVLSLRDGGWARFDQ